LLGAGQHRDRLDQLTVGRQGSVGGQVGAQDVGQDQRVAVVGLLAGHRVPLAVAGNCQRVDRKHRPAGGAEAGDQQPAAGLDRHWDRVVRGIAVGGQQLDQHGEPGGVVADPLSSHQPPVWGDNSDVVWASAQSIPQNTRCSFLVVLTGCPQPRGTLAL
jgi:hypothetical protein